MVLMRMTMRGKVWSCSVPSSLVPAKNRNGHPPLPHHDLGKKNTIAAMQSPPSSDAAAVGGIAVLIDTRPHWAFSGFPWRRPSDRQLVGGHLPGAVSLPAEWLSFGDDGGDDGNGGEGDGGEGDDGDDDDDGDKKEKKNEKKGKEGADVEDPALLVESVDMWLRSRGLLLAKDGDQSSLLTITLVGCKEDNKLVRRALAAHPLLQKAQFVDGGEPDASTATRSLSVVNVVPAWWLHAVMGRMYSSALADSSNPSFSSAYDARLLPLCPVSLNLQKAVAATSNADNPDRDDATPHRQLVVLQVGYGSSERDSFLTRHIPRAIFLDTNDVESEGRHWKLNTPEVLAEVLGGRLGLSRKSSLVVVVYSAGPMAAYRVAAMLEYMVGGFLCLFLIFLQIPDSF